MFPFKVMIMSILKDLGEPEEFWDFFERISAIPHCSRYEERIRSFIKDEAEKFGFETLVDKVGNLAIFIPAQTSQKEKCILQCHMIWYVRKMNLLSMIFQKIL